MTVYRGICDAPKLANGVEIVTETDFLVLNEGDELDVRMPGDGPHYTLAMSEAGDVVKGISVRLWSWADIMVGLRRMETCRFRLSMTEAQEIVANAPR